MQSFFPKLAAWHSYPLLLGYSQSLTSPISGATLTVPLKFFILLVLYASTFSVSAESRHSLALWPMNSSLSQSTIISILNGRDGLLWIATLDGVTRFDGRSFFNFRTYKSGPGFIASTNIVKILDDRSGNIFAATRDAGLLAYNPDTNEFSIVRWNGNELTLNKNISAAFQDDSGGIWIGYDNGSITHIIPHLKSVTHFDSFATTNISDFTETQAGVIFAATKNGEIFRLSEQNSRPKKIAVNKCNLRFSNLVEISAAGKDVIWIGTRGAGLFRLELSNAECSQVILTDVEEEPSSNANVNQIVNDVERKLTWVGTDQGLYQIRRNGEQVHFHTKNTSLANNEIISFSIGNNGVYWVGTYSGLNYLLATKFNTYGVDVEKNVHSVVSIDSSKLYGTWIASYDGLIGFDQTTDSHVNLNELYPEIKFTNEKIMSLHIDSKGMWVGYRSTGLEFYSWEEKRIVSFGVDSERKLSSNAVSAILTLTTGETLIGTYGGGLNVISPQGLVDFHMAGDSKVIMLHQSEDGSIWIGTEMGLYHLELSSQTLTKMNTDIFLHSYRTMPIIWAMAESPTGDLWLGTKHHGLFVWPRHGRDELDTSKIRALEGIPESINTVYSIQIDQLGYIWCATNTGLTRIDPVEGNTKFFGKKHGLDYGEFDFGASHKDTKERLYFGGTNGYVRFDPLAVGLDFPASAVRLTNVHLASVLSISQSRLPQLKSLQLTHQDYFVTFEFSVLDFIDPDKNQFRYKLENFDPQWVENGTRNTATYTNLPAGDYVFRVQGANSAGVWNREGISLHVRVLPAPWATWWAYCIYGVIASILGWMFKRAYDSYAIERRAREVAMERHEAEERADDDMQEQLELQDELVKSAYRHSVATLGLVGECLSLQNNFMADTDSRETAQGSTKWVSALSTLEECLYHQNEGAFADLHKYTDIIISRLLEAAPVRPETITTINEVTTKLIPEHVASPLCIVIYELLENSIHHAFEPESPANYIQTALEIVEAEPSQTDCYKLIVRDSGVGLPDNIRLAPDETCGLAIVRSIVNKLSGSLHIDCEHGTTFSVIIPAKMAEA